MKIALFGAVFDPPHHGHLTIARELLSQQLADEVWLVPVGDHPLNKTMTKSEHRLNMLKLVLESGMKIDLYEIEKNSPSFTIETLQHHTQSWPEHEFFWVIGSDNLVNFNKWHDYQQLLENYDVRVYPRAGFPMELLPGMTAIQNVPVIQVSSTLVRERLASNKTISQLVDSRVEEYIRKYRIYS